MVYLFNTTYISVDIAHHKIFRAKAGKGGIILLMYFLNQFLFEVDVLYGL